MILQKKFEPLCVPSVTYYQHERVTSRACLALVDEAASRLSVRLVATRTFEGDEFLAATAYSDWMGAIDTAATGTESESVPTLIKLFEVASTYRLVGRGHSRSIE